MKILYKMDCSFSLLRGENNEIQEGVFYVRDIYKDEPYKIASSECFGYH